MELLLAKRYWMNVYLRDSESSTTLTLTVFIESRSGKLNPETGSILPIDELDECVNEATEDINGKSIDDIKGLAYLPHTLEIMATRIWERLEETLGYKARLSKIRLTREPDFFIEYIGREQEVARKTKTKRSER